MKKAGAIVTEQGGMTSHVAIVSRELGKPCIIGTKIATKVLKDGENFETRVTLRCRLGSFHPFLLFEREHLALHLAIELLDCLDRPRGHANFYPSDADGLEIQILTALGRDVGMAARVAEIRPTAGQLVNAGHRMRQ